MAKEKKAETTKQPGDLRQSKRSLSARLLMLVFSGFVIAAGLIAFIVYVNTGLTSLGPPAVLMIIGGGFLFKIYWGKTENVVEHVGQVATEQVNCLNIYESRMVFENMVNPEGYPWQCTHDNKKYFVNIWDGMAKRLVPFTLPDQQFCDPEVYGQRVIELPAHKKIFTRKLKWGQVVQTGLLVVGIIIVWILIITTTGE